ncbi:MULTISPECIES: hypothetical protein [Pseudofrankia]|uniref:hypothetical protein n=1 Tax=Pseudofrankia TaxID=2994363 RepID=UPI001042320C|nr:MULTISPECIES: hypothetical protein [Pseudofrankia]
MLSDDGVWAWDAASHQWVPRAQQPAVPAAPVTTRRDDFFAVERVNAPEPSAPAHPTPAYPTPSHTGQAATATVPGAPESAWRPLAAGHPPAATTQTGATQTGAGWSGTPAPTDPRASPDPFAVGSLWSSSYVSGDTGLSVTAIDVGPAPPAVVPPPVTSSQRPESTAGYQPGPARPAARDYGTPAPAAPYLPPAQSPAATAHPSPSPHPSPSAYPSPAASPLPRPAAVAPAPTLLPSSWSARLTGQEGTPTSGAAAAAPGPRPASGPVQIGPFQTTRVGGVPADVPDQRPDLPDRLRQSGRSPGSDWDPGPRRSGGNPVSDPPGSRGFADPPGDRPGTAGFANSGGTPGFAAPGSTSGSVRVGGDARARSAGTPGSGYPPAGSISPWEPAPRSPGPPGPGTGAGVVAVGGPAGSGVPQARVSPAPQAPVSRADGGSSPPPARDERAPNIFFTPARGLPRPTAGTPGPGGPGGPGFPGGGPGFPGAGMPASAPGGPRTPTRPGESQPPGGGQGNRAAGVSAPPSSPWRVPETDPRSTTGVEPTGGTGWSPFTRTPPQDATARSSDGPPGTGWRSPPPPVTDRAGARSPAPPELAASTPAGRPVIDPRDPLGTGDLLGLPRRPSQATGAPSGPMPSRPSAPGGPLPGGAAPGGPATGGPFTGGRPTGGPAGGGPFPGQPIDGLSGAHQNLGTHRPDAGPADRGLPPGTAAPVPWGRTGAEAVPSARDGSQTRGGGWRGRRRDGETGPRTPAEAPGLPTPGLPAPERAGTGRQPAPPTARADGTSPADSSAPREARGADGHGTSTSERSTASRRPAPVEMTSVLSRTAASLPRRGMMRSVPADRRRTPNPMTDSMSLQAVTPAASPGAPERSAGRRARGGQDQTGATTGSRTSSRTGPETSPGRKSRGAGESDEPPADPGRSAGLAGAPRGLEAGAGVGGGRAGQREDGSRPRPHDPGAGLDPLTGPRGAQEAVGSDDGGRLAGRGATQSRKPAGGAGRRFAADDLEDALELGEAERTSRRPPTTDGDHAADDRLAWFRQGWLGPLTVAVVVALVSLGIYVLLAGRGGGGRSGASGAAASATLSPAGTNADAKAGKALVDGTYSCVAGAAPAAPAASATAAAGATPGTAGPSAAGGAAPGAHAGALVIPPTSGKYQWNGQQGDYTIATPKFDDASNVIAAVAFTSGPLQGQVGNSIAVWPAGARVQATVYVTKGGNMSCALD